MAKILVVLDVPDEYEPDDNKITWWRLGSLMGFRLRVKQLNIDVKSVDYHDAIHMSDEDYKWIRKELPNL